MVLPGKLQLLMTTTAGRITECLSAFKTERWLQVASPFAGRVHPATRRTVGCCINTLAMRTRLQGLATLGELVAAVRGTALAAYRNAEASLHTVMQAMGRCPEESLFSVRPPCRPAPALGRPHLQAVLHQAHLALCWKHTLCHLPESWPARGLQVCIDGIQSKHADDAD